MPDGHTCLLALPPECTEGEGPTVMPYLKLFCRYITDRKVSLKTTSPSVKAAQATILTWGNRNPHGLLVANILYEKCLIKTLTEMTE